MQKYTKAALREGTTSLVEEFCSRCNVPAPAPGSAKERACLENATSYVASLVVEGTMPPWVDERPASAPGGMGYRFSWEVMKTTGCHS